MDILKQVDAYRTTEWRNNDIFTADFIVFLHGDGVLYQMNPHGEVDVVLKQAQFTKGTGVLR